MQTNEYTCICIWPRPSLIIFGSKAGSVQHAWTLYDGQSHQSVYQKTCSWPWINLAPQLRETWRKGTRQWNTTPHIFQEKLLGPHFYLRASPCGTAGFKCLDISHCFSHHGCPRCLQVRSHKHTNTSLQVHSNTHTQTLACSCANIYTQTLACKCTQIHTHTNTSLQLR